MKFYEIKSRKDDTTVAVLPATAIVIARGNVGSSVVQGATREAECFLMPTGQALPTDQFYAEPVDGLPARFVTMTAKSVLANLSRGLE
jgi:hypothetical protein